jgi:AraC family transcriptional regulator, alkane utilization regulator
LDVLLEWLSTIRLTGAAFIEADLQAPWSFVIPPSREIVQALMPQAGHLVFCHVITAGSCNVRLADGSAVELAAGEVVMFPAGDQHLLCCTCERTHDTLPARNILQFFSRDKVGPLRDGGGGDTTGVVSGFFACDPQFAAPMLAALPRVMRISLNSEPCAGWLQSAIRFSVRESAHVRAGAANMLTKVSELLFTEAVRRHIEQTPSSKAGWLGGLRDPHTARALALLHQRPQHAWTVDALAEEVGIARSTLTERFTRLVTQSPMQYLKRLRLRLAAKRLLDTKENISRVAELAGYGSEAAFSRAFKHEFELPPAAWRRRKGR